MRFAALALALATGCSCDDDTGFRGYEDAGGGGDGAGGGEDAPGVRFDGGPPPDVQSCVDAGEEPCVFIPEPGPFAPALECRWSGPGAGGPYPARADVVMTPAVANLSDDDGDGDIDTDDVPDIAFVSYDLDTGCCNAPGVLRIVAGQCDDSGALPPVATIGRDEIEADTGESVWLDNSGGLAVGDLDGDGVPDIVAMLNDGGTIAFETDVATGAWSVKWLNTTDPARASDDMLAGAQPAIADFGGDAVAEVVVGRVILDGLTGALLYAGDAGRGINAFMGPISVVSDVDLDGTPDIIAGDTRYTPAMAVVWQFDFSLDPAWPAPGPCGNSRPGGCDGFNAIGNFDDDDEAEIVIVRRGVLYVLNHDGTVLEVGGVDAVVAIPVDNCAYNEGGPPTVADFDGDGQAEIGVAAGDFYTVFDFECLAAPLPAACEDAGVRWTAPNQDCSSRVTASSVFDFDGNGAAEVVYNDEVSFRIFDGTTGAILVDEFNGSHTRLEMPVIADVDNDGNAEVVFAENGYNGGDPGIEVWGDPMDAWVPTRRIWNQHTYHITNITEGGLLPPGGEGPNWLEPTDATASGVMNNFRQNLPDYDPFLAPDLTVEVLGYDNDRCPSVLDVGLRVCNVGDVVVGPGVEVHVYDATSGDEIACVDGPLETTTSLSPGACEDLVCGWPDPPQSPDDASVTACVDNEGPACTGGAEGANNECNEDNNTDSFTDDGCENIG